jgi:hypothetical protein
VVLVFVTPITQCQSKLLVLQKLSAPLPALLLPLYVIKNDTATTAAFQQSNPSILNQAVPAIAAPHPESATPAVSSCLWALSGSNTAISNHEYTSHVKINHMETSNVSSYIIVLYSIIFYII